MSVEEREEVIILCADRQIQMQNKFVDHANVIKIKVNFASAVKMEEIFRSLKKIALPVMNSMNMNMNITLL